MPEIAALGYDQARRKFDRCMVCPVTTRRVVLSILGVLALCCPGYAARDRTTPNSPDNGVVRLPVIDKQDIRFLQLSSEGESFQNWIRSIAQDHRGFLWLGTTAGLFRYDGYSLKSYRHEPGNRNSLSDDAIRNLCVDRAGILWVGTDFGGLDRFDPVQETFTHYRYLPDDTRSLSSDSVSWVLQDQRGALWVGTSRGLDRLDPASGGFIHYRHDAQDAGSLSHNAVLVVYEDRLSNLWVGTGAGLNKLDRATGRFQHFRYDPMNPRSLGIDYVDSLWEDHLGVLWVGSRFGRGLSALDLRTDRFTRYSFHAEDPGSLSLVGVTQIYEDQDGVLWLGTMDRGLLKLDRERKQFTRYGQEPSNPNSLDDNAVKALFEDSEGVMWVGTQSGLSRFLRKPPPFVNYKHQAGHLNSLDNDKIRAVQADSQGFLWFGTDGALDRLDQRTGQFKVYRHDARDAHSLSYDKVSVIREDPSGTLWFGTYGGGLNRFDRATGRFFAYHHDDKNPTSLSSDMVISLLVDRRGVLWVGTQTAGLNRFDPKTGRFSVYRNDPHNSHSLSYDWATVIFEDRGGIFWVGTSFGGLNRFDPGTGEFTVYRNDPHNPLSLSHNKVNSILEDRRGILWIGTQDGLNQFDRDSGSFIRFMRKDGLPDDSIEAILEDDQGYIWLATHYGLSRFDPRRRTFHNYSESDGLPGNLFNPDGPEASARTADGELILGSSRGVTTIYPKLLSDNPHVPPVVLTEFSLFNKPVVAGAHSPLRKPIWATSALTLTHAQSIFTIEFSALSYSAPQKNRYRYRLEGLENEWNDVDSTRRQATYTNLPAANYVFQVQGSNQDGVWNETGATLAIRVLPPWWATWWFTSIASLTVAGLIFAVYRSRVTRLELEAARLEAQVKERTSELSERTVELQIARDAAESANRAKTIFLANMSHELRTPLNAILGFSDLLLEGDTSEKQRKDLDIIHHSGEHLLELINDVLDVAKIEAGRIVVENAACDVHGLVRDITAIMRMRARAKNLQLLVEQSAGLPRLIRTDASKLRQILTNLLGNAVRYTERGTIILRLNGLPADSPGHVLLLFEVEDTGVGIAAEDQARIFEPFERVGGQGSQDGTGLGLAIVRKYVELMGGAIRVESELGKGSRFRMELPVERELEVEATAPMDNRPRVVGIEPGQPEYRVLIVEDKFENRLLLQRLLERVGFRVRVAEDGEKGIETFQSWRPHFIWMDHGLRGIDGREAVQRIRELDGGREVKIAMVTASVHIGQRDEMLASGLDDFLGKPYQLEEIFDCMARHLDVRYVRAESASCPDEQELDLRPEALAAIPQTLREELLDGLIALDAERISRLIRRISEVDPALGGVLTVLAGRFAYTPILHALRGAKGRPATG